MFAVPSPAAALAWRALLTALLLAACVTDVRARRIPNALVLALTGAAFVRAAVVVWAGEPAAGLAAGFGDAALGAAAGLALWLPLYAVGAFGAGDVKLFAAAAAWLGPTGVPSATLYAALAGGVLGLAWLATRQLPAVFTERRRVPYGVAIAAGVLGTVWVGP